MISESIWARLQIVGSESQNAIIGRERAQQWLREYEEAGHRPEQFSIHDVPHCRCCGGPATGQGRGIRCERHVDRNPCVVEGCKRSRSAPSSGRLSDDEWICSEHWRRYVPPRSRLRRTYHAHFRRAKKHGWDAQRTAAFWRFWEWLVGLVRSRAAGGHLDEAEINRLMGWE